MARRVPQRTCLGCQSVRPKREMIRLVKTPEGSIEIDLTGKKSGGRGSYVCPDPECLERIVKSKRIEKALLVVPPQAFYEELRAEIEKRNRDARR